VADQPNTPPTVPAGPPKPFKVSKWILGVFILFAALYIAISLIHIDLFGRKEAAENHMPSAPAGQSILDTFDKGRQQKMAEIARKRDLMIRELKNAGLDEETLMEIVNQLPPCDDAMRIRLAGQNYVAANQKTKQAILLNCGLDDTWHPLPQEATAIEPPTARQAKAMHSGGGTSASTSAKDKAAAALEAALKSNGVVEFVEPTAAGSTRAATASEAAPPGKAIGMTEHGDEKTQNPYLWNSSTGKQYEVFEGKIIEGILANRLAGEFTGPVDVMVTTNFYSIDHQHVLIPQGARILGESSNVNLTGQKRLAVVFHRIIMQDGYSVNLDKFHGLDQQGASGLTGRVDTHWPSLIATAVLVGAISGLSEYGAIGTGGGLGYIGFGVGQQTGQAATQILDRALNRLPTITVYEGTRVRIWVQRDFTLPDVDNHTIIPNL
jgi:type IV secretion system protein VirB10